MIDICDVCSEPAEQAIILKCMHKACRLCEEDLRRDTGPHAGPPDARGLAQRRCPVCFTTTYVHVDGLAKAMKAGCLAHAGRALDFYCVKCSVSACSQCPCVGVHDLVNQRGLADLVRLQAAQVTAALTRLDALLDELRFLQGRFQRHLLACVREVDEAHAEAAAKIPDGPDAEALQGLQARAEGFKRALEEATRADLKLVDLDVELAATVRFSLAEVAQRIAQVAPETQFTMHYLEFLYMQARRHRQRAGACDVSATHVSFPCILRPATPETFACAYVGRTFALRPSNFAHRYEDVNATLDARYQRCVDELPDGDFVVIELNHSISRRRRRHPRHRLDTWKDIEATHLCVCPAGNVWIATVAGALVCATAQGQVLFTITEDEQFVEVVATLSGLVLAYGAVHHRVHAFRPDGGRHYVVAAPGKPSYDDLPPGIRVGRDAFTVTDASGDYVLHRLSDGALLGRPGRAKRVPDLWHLFTVPGRADPYELREATIHSRRLSAIAWLCPDQDEPRGFAHSQAREPPLPFWGKTGGVVRLLHDGTLVAGAQYYRNTDSPLSPRRSWRAGIYFV